jgi:hypothetical protein
MSLTEVQRAYLLNGGSHRDVLKAFNGSASLWVAWRKHRDELMAACAVGRRPWGYWLLEKGLKCKPAGEASELRLIRQLDLYRDADEKAYVEQRLGEIVQGIRDRRNHRAVA